MVCRTLTMVLVAVWAAILNTYLLVCYLLRFKTIYRKLAQRTSWAILVSGFSTVINLSVLLILQGQLQSSLSRMIQTD